MGDARLGGAFFKVSTIIVVGGGAAGLIAAWRAARLGADVLLLEKGKRLGTKILISGGGKCNVTHDGPIESVRAAFRKNEASFLKAGFYRFDNAAFVRLLTDRGMDVYTRPDGRIFPVPPSDAKDVVDILEGHVRDAGVKIWLDCPVINLCIKDQKIIGVETAEKIIPATQVIIATGGSSFPGTGCTGDGWKWLAAAGHTIVPTIAALAPLYLDPTPPAEWSGVALRDCVLRARKSNPDGTPGKERMHWRGDLLFTHKGVSGPTALGVSREIAEALPENSEVEIDTLPDESFEQVSARFAAQARDFPRRSVTDFAYGLVPERLLKPMIESAGIDPAARASILTLKERNKLVLALKGWRIGRVRAVPLERGEVVAGGVALGEVDSRTMRSLKISGLYLCGEVLDIAGPVGGYNLQAAWSTGYVAGESAANDAD
jgi:predicted Rossmann fold flavoprotein